MRLNEDVLHIIFGHLDNLRWDQRGTSLVNAAMTCKDFYQPALRVIWRKLDDLFPLFKLFSTFGAVRVITEGKREREIYVSNSVRVGSAVLTVCDPMHARCSMVQFSPKNGNGSACTQSLFKLWAILRLRTPRRPRRALSTSWRCLSFSTSPPTLDAFPLQHYPT